jgi:hypothetical protein
MFGKNKNIMEDIKKDLGIGALWVMGLAFVVWFVLIVKIFSEFRLI